MEPSHAYADGHGHGHGNDEDDEAAALRGPRPRVMAIDVGTVRIGVALSCPLGMFAQPLEVVPRRGEALARLVELTQTHEASLVLVGRPLRLNGTDGPAVAATEAFMAHLGPRLPCPWQWADERLSTRAAERDMIAMGTRRKDRRQSVDKVAAAIILQGYLDAQP